MVQTLPILRKAWMRVQAPVKEFKGFDKDAIRYMAMHWIGGGLLIYETILPAFMNMQNISVFEAGIMFSIASILDVILTYFLSKFFDRISPNIGMALDWLTESIPPLIYGFASSMGHFLLGRVAGRVTNVLNPVYKLYENEVYPEDKRSLLYAYHMMTPEIFTILFYPLIGYLLAYVFPTAAAFRVVFWICGVAYLFVALIPLKGMRWVEPVKITGEKSKTVGHFSRDLYLAASAEVMCSIGLGLTPTLVTSYYILQVMHGNVFHLILLEVFSGLIGITAGLFTKDWGMRMSEEKGAIYGTICMSIYSLMMIFSKNYAMILFATLFRSIGDIIWFPNHQALMMRRIPREKQGIFFGKLYSLKKFLAMLLPGVSCFLASQIGFYAPYAMGFGSLIIVCMIYQILRSQSQPTDAKNERVQHL